MHSPLSTLNSVILGVALVLTVVLSVVVVVRKVEGGVP